MKILHITYHSGCDANLKFVAKQLGYEIETQWASWNYNIGHDRAKQIWDAHKDYYNSFDVIITSDTGPLSRIFFQNNFQGKLIVWVCNRFDYCDEGSNDCKFPDKEYYDLFRTGIKKKNVKVYSYTKFEHEYADTFKKVNWKHQIIKPCSFIEEKDFVSAIPENIKKEETFFIPPYHNDTILLNLKSKCDELGINAFSGRYNGPSDLKGIKGIIHIPYAWSNLALFENWSIGNVYLIPSKDFLFDLAKTGDFFWSPPFAKDFIESSEWYLPAHKDLFLFFEGWPQLITLSRNAALIAKKSQKVMEFSQKHTAETLVKWKSAIEEWT